MMARIGLALLISLAAGACLADGSAGKEAPAAQVAPENSAARADGNQSQWRIERDERIDAALHRWAASSGWTVAWLPTITWECPAPVSFQGDFQSAVVQVVDALNQDGKRLRLRIYESGRYMEVVADATN